MPTSLIGNRNAPEEQGSCGIRKRLLPGDESRQFAVSQVEIQDARPHFHNDTWELYIVQEGTGTLRLDGVDHELTAGDVIEIPPGVPHQAIPNPSMTVLVVMSPGSAENGDIVYL